MSDTLSADRLTQIIKTGSVEDCIAYLAPHPLKKRRAVARAAVALFNEWNKAHFETVQDGKHRTDVQHDVARVAVLATASLTEVKSCGWNICPPENLMIKTFTQFPPDWLDAWVVDMLDSSPFHYQRVHPLWEKGLCKKPDSESYVFAMIVGPRHSLWPDISTPTTPENWQNREPLANRLRERPDLISDLWRFFEIEGNGEFSLAAYDKYSAANETWATALWELSKAGLMDRDHLLDASLDALARDFAQFRANWYSRFYEAMAPTLEEQVVRKGRFLQLLGSANPPTVSFALKAIKQIDRATPLIEIELLEAIPSVLQARQKSTVTNGLRLIDMVTKRAPDIRPQALPLVLDALIHEAADVQAKALDLLEKLGIADRPELLEALKDYVDGIAPSLRPRVIALCGAEISVPQITPIDAKQGPNPLDPISSYDAFIAEFLHVLEDTSDPLRVEQAIDGLARYGANLPPDFDRVVGPLAKRAAQILKSAEETTLRYALAHLAQAYASRMPPKLPKNIVFGSMISLGWSHRRKTLGAQSFVTVFIKRNIDVLTQVQRGQRLPLLCAPTDDRGFVAPQILVERVLAYEDTKTSPSPYDLCLALLRLAPEGREAAEKALKKNSEITRALNFALGGELNVGRFNIGKTKWLWVAAAAARVPRADEPRIRSLSGLVAPDVGVIARYDVSMSTRNYDEYTFPEIDVKTSPPITKSIPDTYLSGLFHLTTAGKFSGSICGHNADDIRWASLVWPQNPEPFFSQGVSVFDPEQKLSNSPYAAFIEPALMSGATLGPMGTLLLCQTVASADPAVRGLAIEALILCIEEDRIDIDLLAQFTLDLITKAALPASRWTRSFGELAKISRRHSAYLCELITKLMRFDPTKPPRDIGGLVELLFELHVETEKEFSDSDARACLSMISSGGKLGKFSKRLLSV